MMAAEGTEEQFVRSIARPALEYMNEDQLNNLERVLELNRSTVQTCIESNNTNTSNNIIPPNSTQFNPYLYNSFQTAPTLQFPQVVAPAVDARTKTHTTGGPQQGAAAHGGAGPATTAALAAQGFPPYVQFPFLPFWSACPLPFSPLSYPQIILPPAYTTQPIGPQLLRPVPVQVTMDSFVAQQQQQQQQPKPRIPTTPIAPHPPPSPPVHVCAPSSVSSTPATPATFTDSSIPFNIIEREQKIDKYRDKRAKRNWSRKPDPKLARMASERPRDQSGKFVSATSAEIQELKQELYEMKQQLLNTEYELDELRNMRQNINDDMYWRSVNNVNIHAVQPFQVHQQTLAQSGVIYSPFRGGNTAVEAFKEKIDFATKRESLKKTHSPFLPGQQTQEQQHWQELAASCPQFLTDDDRWESGLTPADEVSHEAEKQAQWVDQLLNAPYGSTSSDDEDMTCMEP